MEFDFMDTSHDTSRDTIKSFNGATSYLMVSPLDRSQELRADAWLGKKSVRV